MSVSQFSIYDNHRTLEAKIDNLLGNSSRGSGGGGGSSGGGSGGSGEGGGASKGVDDGGRKKSLGVAVRVAVGG
jgi:hypothetical protein